ncbi:MAG: 3-hydroxybutyrate dehydrogenase [Proteobacteria bacterium]|nr:MAG: 3-hydroxybutyrate dehydrogenase [Pseudomonadota bacterium]
MRNLTGKGAIVTGSTSGIGLGIAGALASRGADIVLNGFGDAAEIEALRSRLSREHGVTVHYSGADLTKPDRIAELIAQSAGWLEHIDILVNNAGIQHTDRIETFPDERWDSIIALNLSAAFHTMKAVIPGMRERNWGRVINIASVHGLVASTDKSAYVAAKHGLVGLTKVAALENADTGVTCNAICPGWVHTGLLQKQIDDMAARDSITAEEAMSRVVGGKQPSGNVVKPEQIGELAAFLCSDAAAEMRGAALPIDGGWTAV